MPAQLDAVRNDFVERVVEPARAVLGTGSLYAWLGEKAELVARAGRHRTHIQLGPPVRAALHVEADHLEYGAYKEVKGKRWTGSIDLSVANRTFAVARVGPRDMRALEAHELGHLLLSSDQRMWRIFHDSSLIVDPAIERLTDDAARIILLPDSLLNDLLAVDGRGDFRGTSRHRAWGHLPRISTTAIVPDRMAASRMAQLLVQSEAALICYSVRIAKQHDLFAEVKSPSQTLDDETSDITVRWIMNYCWFGEGANLREYLFSDRIGFDRRVKLRGAERGAAHLKDPAIMETTLLRRIMGERNWSRLDQFAVFTRVAATDRDGTRYVFVLAEPASP